MGDAFARCFSMCWDISKPMEIQHKDVSAVSIKGYVFEVVASGGASDLRFATNPVQQKGEVLMSSIVGCVTDRSNKGCDDSGALF